MQQRVELAQALATERSSFLDVWKFSALDPLIRFDVHDGLLVLQNELQKTILFITHELEEALKLGDSIEIFRDGFLIRLGSPQ